jgi:hypothetical protein
MRRLDPYGVSMPCMNRYSEKMPMYRWTSRTRPVPTLNPAVVEVVRS